MTVIRVVLADDQELLRAGFRMILESHPDITVVGEASDGAEAIELVRATACDVVLMDVRMPRIDGIAATRAITTELRDPPKVLILTTFDLDEYVYEGLRAGASGFLLKDAPPPELVHAIRVVAAGDSIVAPAVTKRLIDHYLVTAATPNPDLTSQLDALTPRERDVLLEVAKGLSNAEIGESLFLSEATVKTHIGHILTKLRLRDRVQVVVLAYELGLVAPGRPAGPASRQP
jgi:DNA-binding NarL/FixJ family response regulator